jgi:hypothetical protein
MLRKFLGWSGDKSKRELNGKTSVDAEILSCSFNFICWGQLNSQSNLSHKIPHFRYTNNKCIWIIRLIYVSQDESKLFHRVTWYLINDLKFNVSTAYSWNNYQVTDPKISLNFLFYKITGIYCFICIGCLHSLFIRKKWDKNWKHVISWWGGVCDDQCVCFLSANQPECQV